MSQRRVNESSLIATADAIRAKAGTTDPITWVEGEGFKAAVEAIPAGGSSLPSASRNDVTFIDYDGTVLYSYTTAEAQALSELPPLPEHEGLICQGWNYDLATIKEYDRPVTVGAMYITDDGKTRIYITLHEGRTSPRLGVCPNGTVTVDWGDGTTPDTLTGTSVSTVRWTTTHNYAAPGDYVISLTVDGEMGLSGTPSTNQFSYLLRYASGTDIRNGVYQNAIKKIEVGNGVTSIGSYAFIGCYSLASVTIPDGVASIGNDAFNRCYCLASVTIPDGVASIGNYAFYSCYSLASVTIPDGVASIEYYAFDNCYFLASITIPDGVASIRDYAFYNCYFLASVTIPASVTSIGISAFRGCHFLASVTIPASVTSIRASAFSGCRSLASVTIPASVTSIENNVFYDCYGANFYDFTNHTVVPTLSNTNAFSSIPADCEIRVPTALYDEWIAATNWSTYASQIVAV